MSSKTCSSQGPDADRVRCQPTASPVQLQNLQPHVRCAHRPIHLCPHSVVLPRQKVGWTQLYHSAPAAHAAFPSPLVFKSHHIPQHWRFSQLCPAALRWCTPQGMLQMPGGRTDPQCHDLTLHSATQQYGCIQDPVWERTRRATKSCWEHMYLASLPTLRHKKALQGFNLDPVERTPDRQERYLHFPRGLF